MLSLREKLDVVFSKYIRSFYADWQGYVSCYTCEKRLYWKEAQCGHFIKRGHSSVRFDEENARPQCNFCNVIRGGEEKSFEEHLRDDLGDKRVDLLINRGKGLKSYSDSEYRDKIKLYTGKILEKSV